ncbi:hypothetical protein MAR_005500 [Mya arenaria]|uniref:Uncharacterized protein n=1 Tax=Mya arenaria TaxID=6604 RepID=A0ABY7EZQ2_MYAAR|nr:hypothetical protein MAR_005500 [Mya arenaria]
MEIYRTDQSESKQIFLPRLVSSSVKIDNENKPDIAVKESDNRFRLPEISMVPNENTSMALNRSITDLLDPETEILNRIKHGSKKKKRRRKRKYVTVTPPTGEEENINRTYCV